MNGFVIGFTLVFLIIVAYHVFKRLRTTADLQKNVDEDKQTLRIDKFRKRPDREVHLWEKTIKQNELMKIRDYVIAELSRMELTDWAFYALTAVMKQSPEFSKLLISDMLDIEFIKINERSGINNAVEAIKTTNLNNVTNLRQYFHNMFENIYRATSYGGGNKFYWYGRDRVINTLRSYRASRKKFMPSDMKFYDVNGEEFKFDEGIDSKTIKKIKESIEGLREQSKAIHELKKQCRFEIKTKNPIIEFDLETIAKKGNFKYNGSFVNSLYIDIRALLGLCQHCVYDGNWATSTRTYDVEASYFSFEEGTIMVAKYRGAVNYFPDRLYVEFVDIDPDSWIIRWLKSYKLHLEAND